MLLPIIRCEFWLLKGKNLVKEVVRNCVTCVNVKPCFEPPIMGNLPQDRLTVVRCFNITGVDFCGPGFIKTGIRKIIKLKAYVCVIICFATKAIPLELVSSLSSDAILSALQRFISRRGKPKIVHSDNGTNFDRANRKLNEWHNSMHEIKESSVNEGIQWKFIPSGSPPFGGLWESAVKLMKYHIIRTLGGGLPNFEEMSTLLYQTEACLNSRPLTPLSSDPNDPAALTPARFLINSPLCFPIEPDHTETLSNRLKRWQLVQQLKQLFWKRWSREYLSTLQQKVKWKSSSPNLTEGMLIVMKEENLAPWEWKSARVSERHPGRDGVVRVVSVRTASGATYLLRATRPATKLAVLPVD